MKKVEARLDSLAADVAVLKDDVAVLKDDVGVLKVDVAALKVDVAVLKDDVRGLHVLYEEQNDKISLIAEVQAHHGRRLDEHGALLVEIREALRPLPDVYDFVKRVAHNHDARLEALERHTGLKP